MTNNLPAGSVLCGIVLLIATHAFAQQAEPERGIGYPSVAAALEALKARSDVHISHHGEWTIANDARDGAIWSFAPPSHPAHPAVVKRSAVQRDGQVWIDMRALCQAEKAACDKLMEEFKALNQRVIAEAQQRAQKSTPAPSEEQKARAAAVLAGFFQALDSLRHRDAYEMFTPRMKATMAFEEFVGIETQVREKTGGGASRTLTRTTWYKDPPQAPDPGVYVAYDLSCSYRNANLCTELLVLHEQASGEFLVTRHERNFIDKDAERKLRDAEEKRRGS
jgi:hypothetical protein